jgi:hypothetical protein
MQLFSKVFIHCLQGIVDFPPDQLLNELFSNVENIPNWNPSILEARTVQVSM